MTAILDRQQIIASAQSGDAIALNRLLDACQVDARRYARRHCSANDVDDAVQEALLILSRKVKGLKVAASFSGWLFTIVRRECQRLARRMFGHATHAHEIAEDQFVARPEPAVRIDLIAALESLPAHYLEVLLLRDFAELTIGEIADQLQIAVPGVKSRLHRARELVREYMLISVDSTKRRC